jgi:hypothetical protein
MPMTTSSTPVSAAFWMMASRAGMVVSPPSRLKRFWPMYFLCRNSSKTTVSLSFLRMRCFFSSGNWILRTPPSMRSRIQLRSRGLRM